MLKAKEMDNSVWMGNDGDQMVVSKEGREYVATGNSFQLVETSAAKIQRELKKEGYEHIGWD